ncbi:MAG: hypothetical protein ACREIP_14930 [Alphaproteobacteria bacterium]
MTTPTGFVFIFALAAFAATSLPLATANAKETNATPPKDTSECLKVLGRKANYLVCDGKVYKLPSLIKRNKA